MTHYVVVRADLPHGAAAAQIVHAAGESSNGVPSGTYAVVLGAENEDHLLVTSSLLQAAGIPHTVIREPDEPYCGAAMAIGVKPLPRSEVRRALKHLRLYGERK